MSFGFTHRIAIVLLLPVCGALFTLIVFYFYINSTLSDEHIVNVAGRQRMLSEKIFAYSHLMSVNQSEYQKKLQDSMAVFDSSLHALEFGGYVMGQIVPVAPKYVKEEIESVKNHWAGLKKKMAMLGGETYQLANLSDVLQTINSDIHQLTVVSDSLVFAFQRGSQSRQQLMLKILAVVVVLNMVLFVFGIVFSKRYIAERTRSMQALKDSEKEWRLTFDAIPDFISLHDNDYKILRANKALADYVGLPASELVGKNCYEFFNCQTNPKQKCPMQKSIESGQEATEELDELAIGVPLQITTSPVIDDAGEVIASVHISRDISERKRYEERLRYLAHHDDLTDLPNRSLFVDRLRQEIIHSQRHEKLLAVLFLDLDRFKVMNDTLGHVTADRLLQDVAARLHACVREGDTLARQGGDEFVILLSDIDHREDAGRIAQKINNVIAEPFVINNRQLFITTSIGISIYPDDGEDDQNLIKNADMAMYRAKDEGRATFQYYQPSMGEQVRERLVMESSLRQAMQRGEFFLRYQARLNMKSGELTGVEALLRWQHPEMGEVLPDQFVPLLEETGLIEPVGDWVLRTACKQAKQWQKAGFPYLNMSVNLSARQFNNKGLANYIASLLHDTKLDASCLELEITESILMEHNETVVSALYELSKIGIRLAIDDFGTGYSSLSYLKRFPIQTLKIDRAFIKDIPYDPDDVAITLAIIALAKNMHLKVVAEGVETEQQLELLRQHECDELQGFYFGKPMLPEGLACFLQQQQYADSEDELHRLANEIEVRF